MLLLVLIVAVILATVALSAWVDAPRWPPAEDHHQRDFDMRRR